MRRDTPVTEPQFSFALILSEFFLAAAGSVIRFGDFPSVLVLSLFFPSVDPLILRSLSLIIWDDSQVSSLVWQRMKKMKMLH